MQYIKNNRIIKNSIIENYSKPSLKFETNANSVNREFISDVLNNISISYTISANGINQINDTKKWLENNIKLTVIQPIYSTITKTIQNFINTDIITLQPNSDIIYLFKKNDYIAVELDSNNYVIEKIIEINGLNITLENNITIPINTNIYLGREMTISNNIGIDKVSNTHHKFNITLQEL